MGQVLDGSATTTAAVRRATQHSQKSLTLGVKVEIAGWVEVAVPISQATLALLRQRASVQITEGA
jgi:hypothetical protein